MSAKGRRPGPRKRGYDATWQRERAKVVAAWRREGWPCAGCGQPFRRSDSVHVDHIEALVDRPDLRLDWSNLRCLHERCHNAHTQRQRAERRDGYSLDVGPDGLPSDPRHPFNQ